MHTLAQLKILRCYKPDDFGKPKSIELHSFSNASISEYGQCSYVRIVNDQQKVHCSLVIAKSRVTPLKPVTVPRLELTAAVVSTKISAFLQKELKYGCVPACFWTESKVVLGYISIEARRFHTFVANRVQGIRDHTFLTNGTTLTPKTTQQTMHQEVEELEMQQMVERTKLLVDSTIRNTSFGTSDFPGRP